ncbi:UNVERIFIED_CONTAM: hypothetical protein Sangu_1488300 [Sesamum angustifolium]|uniref:DUF7953 domain-containing protein n=1 Tax=Sesamum angustifolium TaxID=2727405 RepID=A0AAW2MRZ4_9LAMI
MAFLSLLVKSVLISAAVVTLDSILIYKTHDWLPAKKTVYFQCKGEHSIVLPDVKEKHVLYTFKGEESWQPLTELKDTKCKRCGFYEKDAITTMTPFDEWEFCASDFTRSDGKYVHLKEKEVNATFLCPECVSLANGNIDWNRYLVSLGILACGVSFSMVTSAVFSDAEYFSNTKNYFQGMHWILVGVIAVLVSAVVIAGFVTAYKYWQKRKRQQEQARFLRLFEEGDDIEDELGIGPLSSV